MPYVTQCLMSILLYFPPNQFLQNKYKHHYSRLILPRTSPATAQSITKTKTGLEMLSQTQTVDLTGASGDIPDRPAGESGIT